MTDGVRFYDRALRSMSRRQLLNVAWKLGAATIAPLAVPRTLLAQPLFRDYPFPLGVASGDPWPESVVLWTRLAPEPLDGGGMPTANVEVGWEVARDRAFRDIALKGTVIARPELGHAVHVEAQGLQPGREYWYRFHAGSEVSPAGRTKTAPAAGSAVDRLRFAVCGCNHFEAGFFTAFRRIAAAQFDFVFHTGDYIYEGRADGGRSAAVVRQHHGQEIYTVVDYRNRYAQYKSDPDLHAAHASAPFVMTWDDHEVDNDYAGDTDENDTPAEVFLLRRAAAYQAYYESMPLRHSTMPDGPGDAPVPSAPVRNARGLQCARHASVSIQPGLQRPLRDRLHGGTRRLRARSSAASRSAGCSTGSAGQALRGRCIGQQVPTFARNMIRAAPQGQYAMDKWDGYPAARERLYTRLSETKAANPIVLSGDVHLHYGADLKLDFVNAASPTVGVEFTNTSATSGGDGAEVAATWEQVRPDNPHIKYHSARRGYIDCTATPSLMRADFKILDRVTTPDAPERTGGTLVVEAGQPGSMPG